MLTKNCNVVYGNLIECLKKNKRGRFWEKARARMLRHGDPVVRISMDGALLDMRLSHNLPIYYYAHRKYDRLLPEICSFMQNNDGKMKLMDVGANIGDTAALVAGKASGDILCVEGMPDFLPLLRVNANRLTNCHIEIADVFCSNENGVADYYEQQSVSGTAKLVKSDASDSKTVFTTLDRLVERFPNFKDANILKIDTDGFEAAVIEGGRQFLKTSKSVVYFEFLPADIAGYGGNPSAEEKILPLLHELGYGSALFYDNFGNFRFLLENMADAERIRQAVERIDCKDIYYYDVLVISRENEAHDKLLEHLVKSMGNG